MPFSLSYIQCKIPDPFLLSAYLSACRDFERNYLCHEEWKSVLDLSTRWSFSSIRELALSSIKPPTPYDQLILARTYSVDHWVVPALSGLCERTTPLTLSEARQMSIEDVILVSTVREHIRGGTIQVDAAEISVLVEAEQLIALGHRIPLPSSCESEDDAPIAGAWHSRPRGWKARAEARAKTQEATRLCLDAKTKELADAEEKVRREAEKARLEAEKTRRIAAEVGARLEAEKERKGVEERARQEVEKARKDAEKALAKKAEKAAAAAARNREAEAMAEAEAKAKAAEAEAKRQADSRSPTRLAAAGSSDLFSRIQFQNPPSTNAGPRNSSVMHQSTSSPFPDPLSSPCATLGTAARSSASVLFTGTTLVSKGVSTTRSTQERT